MDAMAGIVADRNSVVAERPPVVAGQASSSSGEYHVASGAGASDNPHNADGQPVVAGTAADDTMVIKKACVLRAKFKIEEEVYIKPVDVVPHPMNRGCDVNEAEQNSVLIESPPDKEAFKENKSSSSIECTR